MNQTPSRQIPLIDVDAHPPMTSMSIDYIGEMDASLFFSRLTRAGIDLACGTLTPPPGFFESHSPAEAVRLLNQAALDLARVQPRYLPALVIHPDCPDVSIEQLEQYASLGLRLFEIEAACLNHPGLAPILTCAQSLGMTASLQGETPEQAAALAGQFPALRLLICGHRSKGYMPDAVHSLLQSHPNLSVNLSGILWSWNYVLHEWTDRLGADRLFFGSGYPFTNPAGKVAALHWELRDQPDAVRELILNKNARTLAAAEWSLTWK